MFMYRPQTPPCPSFPLRFCFLCVFAPGFFLGHVECVRFISQGLKGFGVSHCEGNPWYFRDFPLSFEKTKEKKDRARNTLSGPVSRDTARLPQRYPPIVFGVSTWPIGCD